jgi:hypothetical protein
LRATNDARGVRFGRLPERRDRSCERRTNAAVADERGLHTRRGDLSSSAGDYTNASLKPFETRSKRPPLTGRAT